MLTLAALALVAVAVALAVACAWWFVSAYASEPYSDPATRHAAIGAFIAGELSASASAALLEHLHSLALADDLDLASRGSAGDAGPPPEVADAEHEIVLAAVISAAYRALHDHCRHRALVRSALALLSTLSPGVVAGSRGCDDDDECEGEEEGAFFSGVASRVPPPSPPGALLCVLRVLALHSRDARTARGALMLVGILVNAAAVHAARARSVGGSDGSSGSSGGSSGGGSGGASTSANTCTNTSASANPSTLPRLGDLVLACDVVLDVLEVQSGERDVALWGLYALLHLAASDGDLAGGGAAWASAAAACDDAAGAGGDERVAMLGDSLCAHVGLRGGVRAALDALLRFGLRHPSLPASPGDERIASVAVLLVGVLVKSSPELWRAVVREGAFDAVARACEEHPHAPRLREIGEALLSVEAKFCALAGHPAKARGGAGATIPPAEAAGPGEAPVPGATQSADAPTAQPPPAGSGAT